jgi:hypothetical protein
VHAVLELVKGVSCIGSRYLPSQGGRIDDYLVGLMHLETGYKMIQHPKRALFGEGNAVAGGGYG